MNIQNLLISILPLVVYNAEAFASSTNRYMGHDYDASRVITRSMSPVYHVTHNRHAFSATFITMQCIKSTPLYSMVAVQCTNIVYHCTVHERETCQTHQYTISFGAPSSMKSAAIWYNFLVTISSNAANRNVISLLPAQEIVCFSWMMTRKFTKEMKNTSCRSSYCLLCFGLIVRCLMRSINWWHTLRECVREKEWCCRTPYGIGKSGVQLHMPRCLWKQWTYFNHASDMLLLVVPCRYAGIGVANIKFHS